MTRVDLNSDLGESFGAWPMGDDAALLRHVTSANIACGFHAGDPAVMRRTVQAALAAGVAIGAHPGLPDLAGFGRREMQLTPDEAYDLVLYQVGALGAFVHAAGATLRHVKPHGALYTMAAVQPPLAAAIAAAVRDADPALVLVGLSGSALISAGADAGLRTASEVFADRAYEPDATLVSRRVPGAVHADAATIVAQAVALATTGQVRARDGTLVPCRAETLCLHGDGPHAAARAAEIRAALIAAGVRVLPLHAPAGD